MKALVSLAVLLLAMASVQTYAAVDLNRATQSELETIKGVGPAKAKAIIEYRAKNGGFKSIDDLDKVKGFGKASVAKIKADVTVGESKDPKK